ncbi:MAG: DUF1559 domain-containing protein [Gemmataceae bacterium]
MSVAVATYADQHGRYLPPFERGPDGRPWHSWRVLLLPYLSSDSLHKGYDFSEPWDGPNNIKLAKKIPSFYAFPGDVREDGVTPYLAIVGDHTIWKEGGLPMNAVAGRLDATLLVVENRGAEVLWTEPRDLPFDDFDFKIGSPRGISSLYVDPAIVTAAGTIRQIPQGLSADLLRSLIRIDLPIGDAKYLDELLDGRLRPRKPASR